MEKAGCEARRALRATEQIKNGDKIGEKGGNHQVPPFFCEDQCRQGERPKDEHEGDAYADHLHPIAHWICVPEEKAREEYDEGCFD
jgi:hypothetical protein